MKILNCYLVILVFITSISISAGQKKCIERYKECGKNEQKGSCCNKETDGCTKQHIKEGTYEYRCIPSDCDTRECQTSKDCCQAKDRPVNSHSYNTKAICQPLAGTGKNFCVYCVSYNGGECTRYGCCQNPKDPNNPIYCLQYDIGKKKSFCGAQCGKFDFGFEKCRDIDGYDLPPYHKCNSTYALQCNNKRKKEQCGLHGSPCDNSFGNGCCGKDTCQNGKCQRKCLGAGQKTSSDSNRCYEGPCCSKRYGKSLRTCTNKRTGDSDWNKCSY